MITIQYPIENQFFQRDSKNQAEVKIVGQTDFRCKCVIKLDGTPVKEDYLSGNFTMFSVLKQGIYTAEFSVENTVQKTVKFAVGRVFLCTGHSFAEGIGSSFVTSENVYVQSNIDGAIPAETKFTNNDTPVYKKIKDYAITDVQSSRYEGIWGLMAQKISEKDGCPVMIYHSSWGGTSLKHWADATSNLKPQNYAGYNVINPDDCPYYKTRKILKYLIKNTGLEAVLIMHGENDTNDTQENIEANYRKVIEAMRSDANNPELPVYVSRSTWRSDTEKKVIKAQNNVIANNKNVYPGPDITTIGDSGRKRISTNTSENDEHLNEAGQKEASALWANAIQDYHDKTVITQVVDNIKKVVVTATKKVTATNLIGSFVVLVLLAFISRILKFGKVGMIGAVLLAVYVYFTDLFKIDYNGK